MPFIRNGRLEPGPDPSEGPQGPSFVSHKTRRTLSLSAGSKQKQTGNPDISANNCDPIQQVRIAPPDRQVTSVNVANTFVCFVLLSMAYMISWILRGLRPQAHQELRIGRPVRTKQNHATAAHVSADRYDSWALSGRTATGGAYELRQDTAPFARIDRGILQA